MTLQKPVFIKKDLPGPFPAAWTEFFDETVPRYVKSQFSPKDSWKDKPFDKMDAAFFFKGVAELSDLFTDSRPADLPRYLNHGRFRSGYLLYFLPLQAAKFFTLFELHSSAVYAAVKTARNGPLRVTDLGAGPGTGSIALLLFLLNRAIREKIPVPPIEFEWIDTNAGIMQDGRVLVDKLVSRYPALRDKVTVRMQVMEWWKAGNRLAENQHLILMGNVLNEGTRASSVPGNIGGFLREHPEAQFLLVEPAAKPHAQLLAMVRDELLARDEGARPHILAPCLHHGSCPLRAGRDWCHFSVEREIPGKWFKAFSRKFGAERLWVKYTYLWLAAPGQKPEKPAVVTKTRARLILSDPIRPVQSGGQPFVLVCQPDQPEKVPIPTVTQVRRGDLVR